METDEFLTKLLVFVLTPLTFVFAIVLYARSRKREGGRVFEVTDKDRKQFKDLTPAKLTARFLGPIGVLCLAASFYPLDTSVSWSDRFILVGVGVGLILITIWLVKPRQRPRWWWAVLWGIPSSASFIVLIVAMIIARNLPGHSLPNWLVNTGVLAMITGIPSSILCLIYCIGALVGMKLDKKTESQSPAVGQSVR